MHASRLTMLLRPPSARTICSENSSPPTERPDDLQRELITARRVCHCGFLERFAARCRQVKFPNQKVERHEIEASPDWTEDEEPKCVVRFRKEHDIIDQPV